MTPLKSSLINFIAPRSTIETFDDVCSYHAQSRTSVLLKLMRDYIQEQSPIIQTEIQSLQNLQNNLSNFKRNNGLTESKRRPLKPLSDWHNGKLKRSEPIGFFSDQSNESIDF
jgi:hypothetical protein